MYTDSDDRIIILNSTNGQSSNSVLIIDPVIPNDSGCYICTAFNDAGHSSQMIHVEVQCKVDAYPYPHDILECLLTFLFPSYTYFQSNQISSHILHPPQYKSC